METPDKSEKIRKIIYWIFTLWMALGMASTAIVQLLKSKDELANFTNLGYPSYLMTIIGVWKLLGVFAILISGRLLLKEWAYAGFFFVMSGAVISHLIIGDTISRTFPAVLLFVLVIISWYFRPSSRKISTTGLL
ncbi:MULTISPECIES: DoxX family protein [Elizabethkingia]|uniref:DoxX-like family protein n=1 Tax=Elizabethkingia meningoseptica TaxID=238 RepID=A0A1T3FL19_ELIME|nr:MULTISPECIES: DoxX family protein [Elizabethkingia]AQX13331.1 DoxX-like family protein [Elizabethkingia meningoseptica]MBG0514964.1 DoxX family protein [Elizabethkingia meningoseptica]MDE5434537.1 DoxX family protein [Elizabethkingia meningoseptica]MDE5481416.1 DoxX family protein [Elizabethkingia meningoseptica]MDE5537139.1 DoxX family protein [Elizabethkingia meningoseptica]